MRSWGYVAWRCLQDGTVLAVAPMLFGNGRLYVDVYNDGWIDCFCYDSIDLAANALRKYDPAVDREPKGWKRHPATGRRRPDGDATREYVAL